ncbi:MAG: DUF5103 domain-containing protein [Bacteroidales bacterium]|nr:DUF5103 domain-containing protein [Bacteroidales bacterium]MCF8332854.1 DUF5103 domain-containing protein [Bacteroidales bacterium]
MNLKSFFFIITVALSLTSHAQQEDYYQKDYFRYETHVYDTSIHSLDIHKKGHPLSEPWVNINDLKQSLVMSFDIFKDRTQDLRYTFIHCSATWEPSDIRKTEYIRGFDEGYVEDYRFSYNTLQPFIHYKLIFPSDDMMPLLTGNYLLVVYPKGQSGKPLLSARFKIFKRQVAISATVKKATSPRFLHTKQEVDFSINTLNLNVANPERDLKVIVQQNERKDNKIVDIKPLNISQNTLEYNYEDINLFEGGNEFRHFDLKSFKYQSAQVQEIDRSGQKNQVYLYPDNIRRYKSYTYREDINGKRLIKTTEYEDSEIEADYAWVHFTLPFENPLANGGIYIMGELTKWEFNERSRMEYNYRTKAYEGKLYLKQGYYNYLYAYLQDGKKQATLKRIENSFSDTENNYTIYVYYRPPGKLHDKLIGLKTVSSTDNQ